MVHWTSWDKRSSELRPGLKAVTGQRGRVHEGLFKVNTAGQVLLRRPHHHHQRQQMLLPRMGRTRAGGPIPLGQPLAARGRCHLHQCLGQPIVKQLGRRPPHGAEATHIVIAGAAANDENSLVTQRGQRTARCSAAFRLLRRLS